mmetsp:Transcript_8126/g.36574  ORF Transcript_8126/g.36574 Transcript_8126/m.36574 type:complete len:238 (-) Transcript_8126:2469-3182(-)
MSTASWPLLATSAVIPQCFATTFATFWFIGLSSTIKTWPPWRNMSSSPAVTNDAMDPPDCLDLVGRAVICAGGAWAAAPLGWIQPRSGSGGTFGSLRLGLPPTRMRWELRWRRPEFTGSSPSSREPSCCEAEAASRLDADLVTRPGETSAAAATSSPPAPLRPSPRALGCLDGGARAGECGLPTRAPAAAAAAALAPSSPSSNTRASDPSASFGWETMTLAATREVARWKMNRHARV